jgi:hypothetical protein
MYRQVSPIRRCDRALAARRKVLSRAKARRDPDAGNSAWYATVRLGSALPVGSHRE